MGKLKQAALVVAVGLLEATISTTTDPTLKAFLSSVPYAVLIPYALMKQLYSKEVEEYIQELLESDRIPKRVLQSPEFQQALGDSLQGMIYAKEKERRDLIKRAFLGAYISQDEYAKKNLERLQEVAQRLSYPALQHLSFIKKEILPRKEKEVEAVTKDASPLPGYTSEEFKNFKRRTMTISQFYDGWYEEQKKEAREAFNQNQTEENRARYDLTAAQEQKWRSRFLEFWVEYQTLGIFRQGNDPTIGTLGGGGGNVQYLTEFGEKLIGYVEALSKLDLSVG